MKFQKAKVKYPSLTKKAFNQWQKVKKNFKISLSEYNDYYKSIRKANAKGRRMAKRDNTLYIPKFSLKKLPQTRKEKTKYEKAIKEVLGRNYRTSKNKEIRDRSFGNLQVVFGLEDARVLTCYFDRMSDAEFEMFFKINSDLDFLRYGSPDECSRLARLLQITYLKILERIKEFMKKEHINLVKRMSNDEKEVLNLFK